MTTSCPACGATTPDFVRLQSMVAALAMDDVDAALELGLMDVAGCDACLGTGGLSAGDVSAIRAARDARLAAWAARERYRARSERLHRRAQARRDASAAPRVAATDALARALARARRQ